tara:strand:- start:53 stop:688 length:636 start_codon:yes stop_codon:yes gene_type:complete
MTHEQTGTHTPGLAYQAVSMIASNKQYTTELAKAIRQMGTYTPKELEVKGIVKNGKVNAEGLWNYINQRAKPLLGTRNLDSNDPGYLAQFLAVKRLTEQYGKQGVSDALVERLVATYLNTSTQYVGQRDVQLAGSLPTEDGRVGLQALARIAGQDVLLGDTIKEAKDPTDNQNTKGALEEPLRRTIEEAVDTGKLEQILGMTGKDNNHAHQ